MEDVRSVDRILQSQKELVTPKLYIQRALPSPVKRRIDPFLLLDHIGPKYLQPNEVIHFPPHPHRGFEPVTILLEGKIEHTDSNNEKEILYPGDVHWVTAGSGIIHSEKLMEYEPGFGGTFHSVQLWVNLPAKKKMQDPGIQSIKAYHIPVINEDDGNIIIRIITGEIYGQYGPIKTQTPITICHIRMQPGAKTVFPFPEQHNTFYYVLKGQIQATDQNACGPDSMVVFKNNGKGIEVKANEYSEILLLGGQPLNEPVACYGPFVMNRFPELQQAIMDYEAGKMGNPKTK